MTERDLRQPGDTQAEIEPTLATASGEGWRDWALELGKHEQQRVAGFSAALVLGFVAGIAAVYAFAWLADEVLQQQTTQLDQATLTSLRQFSSPTLDSVARVVSLLGSEAVLVFGVLLLVFFAWQRRWGAAVALVLVTGGAQVLNDVLKELFHRTRPSPVAGFIVGQQFSFPSGHAMVSAAFYFFLAYLAWRLVRGWWRPVMVTGLVGLVALIGLARLYLAAHFLSDVIAGYCAGFVWTDAVVIGSHVLATRPWRAEAEPGSTGPAQAEASADPARLS